MFTQIKPQHESESIPGFTPSEWNALLKLRRRYQQDRDLFSARELERLRFMRWLHETGRLAMPERNDLRQAS
jgi:hypothetical protein